VGGRGVLVRDMLRFLSFEKLFFNDAPSAVLWSVNLIALGPTTKWWDCFK
jgi:hypothetical protein